MIDLMKRLYTALQTFLGNVATTETVQSMVDTAVSELDFPTEQEVQGMIDTSIGQLDIPTDQEIQTMIDDAEKYDSIGSPTYVTDYTEALNSTDGVKCIKYKNGFKRVMGVIKVLQDTQSKIMSVPSGFGYTMSQQGNLQGWFSACSTNGKTACIRMYNNDLFVHGTMGSGEYALDFIYR